MMKIDEKIEDRILFDIIPKHSSKITENLEMSDEKNIFYGKTYKLGVLKRFDYLSTFQSLSVIVRNNFDESLRYYVKGAPERILSLCSARSLPKHYHENLMYLTKVGLINIKYDSIFLIIYFCCKSGLRIIACATKLLPSYDPDISNSAIEHNRDLTFLGFIILKNKLKKDTHFFISRIHDCNINQIISTGDNIFTSISVARECHLIEQNIPLKMVDIEFKDDKHLLKM